MKGLALLLAPKKGGGEPSDKDESGSFEERCDLLADVLGVAKEDREDFCTALEGCIRACMSEDEGDES